MGKNKKTKNLRSKFNKKSGLNALGGLLLCTTGLSGNLWANDNLIRWTGADDPNGSLDHVLETLNTRLNAHFTQESFVVEDDRDLAFNHYKRLVQVKDQVPVHGKSIRIWSGLNSDTAVQVEADLDVPAPVVPPTTGARIRSFFFPQKTTQELRTAMTPELTNELIRKTVLAKTEDPNIRGMDWKDEWKNGVLFRVAKVRGKQGTHQVWINLTTQKVETNDYREFPQGDLEEFSIPAKIFPIYEEVEGKGTLLERVPGELRHVFKQIRQGSPDIYAPLKTMHYYDATFDPTLGDTAAGREEGYWSMRYIKDQAEKIRSSLPLVDNDWEHGVLLQGRFATINIHPDALQKFAPLDFQPQLSTALFPNWLDAVFNGEPAQEMVPQLAFSGKPLHSAEEAYNRKAERLPDHDPSKYLNEGFDEIQVYYAINTLMETLHEHGFTDPELSTRPFNAFLYNPDIAYRDNAFYTDDTINFTTYSAKAGNAARDNGTIWHELGHGIMDRLMGDNIELADTGGLSEGMADFVAAMVVQAVTDGKPFPGSDLFRIINKTCFNLTNEVHDDGEAYGGTMKDFMDAAIKKEGSTGFAKVVDVVLEAMRLTRDYPGLTAPEWFKHILFADSLGRPGVREPNELAPLLHAALAGRNFELDGGPTATFTVMNLDTKQEVSSRGPGSRNTPIPVAIAKTATANFQISASVKSSKDYSFKFPVQVRVQFNGGPLQGAIHWVGEEKGPLTFTLNSEADSVTIPLQVTGTCDEINRADGSCVDFAYVQILNQGETERPAAKKRFYLQIKNPQ